MMRTTTAIVAVLILGCGKPTPGPKIDLREGAAKPAATGARESALSKLREDVTAFDARLSTLTAKLPMKPNDVQGRMRTRIEELRTRRDDLSQLIQRLADADDAGWALLRDRAEKVRDELRTGLDQAAAEFP